MSSNLPDPENVDVDDLQRLIENMPEEKQRELFSRPDIADAGGLGDDIGL